jgi:hypothetical protein
MKPSSVLMRTKARMVNPKDLLIESSTLLYSLPKGLLDLRAIMEAAAGLYP